MTRKRNYPALNKYTNVPMSKKLWFPRSVSHPWLSIPSGCKEPHIRSNSHPLEAVCGRSADISYQYQASCILPEEFCCSGSKHSKTNIWRYTSTKWSLLNQTLCNEVLKKFTRCMYCVLYWIRNAISCKICIYFFNLYSARRTGILTNL